VQEESSRSEWFGKSDFAKLRDNQREKLGMMEGHGLPDKTKNDIRPLI